MRAPVKQLVPENIKNILVIKLDHIGDVLWATPALATLRKNLPDAHITMLCTPYTEPVIRGNPALDRIIVYDRDKLPTYGSKREFLKKNIDSPDLALCLDPRDEAVFLARLSGAKIRAG
ncbi:MAG: glycosyltransferase family 9 protein, partial [Candidatus Eremiobacteraeota bacterium]|nr:glycosyltransferase family 9 protein [Candidatus Eremiobacteraeota bacterium]